jgi:hypothetical protein
LAIVNRTSNGCNASIIIERSGDAGGSNGPILARKEMSTDRL